MLSIVTEVFSHGGTSVWGKELKRSRVRSGGSYDNAVVHGTFLIKLSYKLGNGRSLLSNTNVDTGKRISLSLLVDNGINGNGGLTSLTITNNKLTLSTSNGDQGINGLESGKHGLGNGLSGDNSWSLNFSTRALAVVKRGTSINWLSNTINNTSKKFRSNWNIYNGSGTLDSVSLKNITIISKDYHSNIVLLKVQGHTTKTTGENNHLSCLDVGKTVNTGDTISYRDNCSSLSVGGSGILRSSSS
mmetsp:Transcript_6933/g.8766  ORF Transcript_6933/g.8766 Transcript_6933/m.8766 type:complete len:245 (+) Transcript_6933:4795-5529(+)